MTFSFGYPLALLFLLLIPILLWASLRRREKGGVAFSNVPSVEAAAKLGRSRARFWLLLLRALSLALLVIAFARPRFGSETREIEASGIDIMLALDVSGSMLALDLELGGKMATRLDVVKDVISDFIDRRPNDRIGIVAFGSEPYLMSPLTLHHDWLRTNLGRLKVGMIPSGTSIGPPMGMATNRLRKLEDSHSRVIILLTDGMDSPPPPVSPLRYAEAAAAFGIKIYTIAVGRGGVVNTYMVDPRTNDILLDRMGRPVVRRAEFPLDEKILGDIADKTGGRFFRARDRGELESIYNEIDRLEKTEVKLKFRTDYEEMFHIPLVAGLVFLLLEVILACTRFRRIP